MTCSHERRTALVACLIAIGIGATLSLGAVALVTRDTRQDIDLAEFAHAGTALPALDGYERDTDNLCRGVPGCVQGFRATHATYRKFASVEDAADYASSSPDSHLSNWIVIEYTDGPLTEVDRKQIEEMVDSAAISE